MSAKICKFGCGKDLIWDNNSKSFKEQDGTPHTKERCESLKKPEGSYTSNNSIQKIEPAGIDHMNELVQAIRELTAAIRAGRMKA